MYKNYWLRRKAIREDALILYRLGFNVNCDGLDIEIEIPLIPTPTKSWTGDKNFYKKLIETDWVI